MINETFKSFDIDGIRIRTGETYVVDTRDDGGNSPTDGVPSGEQTAM